MTKAIPMIISNNSLLLKANGDVGFKAYGLPGIEEIPNIPYYHQFAEKIAESQHYFTDFVKSNYGKKVNKNILAIVVPDDTSALETIFIREFFLNSGACKAVAQIKMGQILSKEEPRYISISKTHRNVVLQYISYTDVIVSKYYDLTSYDPKIIIEDSKRIHIDVEYKDVPIYINNFDLNMDDFFEYGEVISPKDFMDKVANIDVEKL